jgi:hypothetical protein
VGGVACLALAAFLILRVRDRRRWSLFAFFVFVVSGVVAEVAYAFACVSFVDHLRDKPAAFVGLLVGFSVVGILVGWLCATIAVQLLTRSKP